MRTRPLLSALALLLAAALAPALAQAQQINPDGTGGNGGNGGGGNFGGNARPTAPDPDYDYRGPLAAASGVLFGAPLGGLTALGASWWVAGPDGAVSDTLLPGQIGALLGNAAGVGAMILLANVTDRDSPGDAPFLIVPPVCAFAGGLIGVLLYAEGESTPTHADATTWGVAPWLAPDSAGLVGAARF